MRRGLPWVLGIWVFAASPIFAQPRPLPNAPAPVPFPDVKTSPPVAQAAPADIAAAPDVIVMPGVQPDTYRFWARAEYLGWWVKNTPQPISLVTGDPNNPTQELLDTNRSLGMFSGFRVGAGLWFDGNNNLGFETYFFALARQTHTFVASSDANGNPTLAFPFINQTPGATGNFVMPITSPGVFAGSVAVSSSLQLWGAEANGLVSLARGGQFEWVALAGFRYLDLYEKMNISTLSADIMTTPNTVLFQSDQFNTRNQFYGGQLGSRFNWQWDRFGFDITGKVALGATHQIVDIQGVSSQSGPGGVNGTFPGGFFSQPSNSGHFSANQFSVVPSVEMKFHVLVTQHLRAFVGYDFIYWSQVVRPGSQVDRNINLSQSAVFGSGALNGPAFPAQSFNRTDFWAQGINVGFELRY